MANFRINVTVDSSGVRKGASEAKKQLSGVESKAKSVQRQLTQAFGFVGLGVAVTQGVRILADFGQTMATVQAITGATATEFAQLRDVAKDLGANTRFSATEAGEGLLFLARAGFTVAESIETVDDTLRLAQAGALDLGQAADIATNVLTGFRLPVSDATRVVDVLALAANSANTSVGQFGEAMKFVAPVAAGLQVPIEEAAAAVGALSDAGLQASLAGTGLRAVLATLERPGAAQKEILDELNVSTDQVRVTTHGLTNVLKTLKAAGIDTGQALALFGKRGGPAFDVMVNSIPKIEELNAKLNDAEGTAERVAAVMDDTLNGALLAVRSAFQAVIIEAGEIGGDNSLTTWARGLAAALRALAANLQIVVRLSTIMAVALFSQFVPGLIASARASDALSVRLAKLRTAMNLTPIGLTITLITALVASLVVFRNEITLVGSKFATLGDLGTAAFEVLGTLIQDLLATLFHVERSTINLRGAISGTVGFVLAMFQGLLQVFDILGKGILGTVSGIIFNFKKIPRALLDVFTRANNAVIEQLETFANRAIDTINIVNEFFGNELLGPVHIQRLTNTAEGAGAEFGAAFLTNFKEEFEQAGLEELYLGLFTRAEEIAAERQAKLVAGAKANAVPTDGTTPPVPQAVSGSPQYDKLLADLEKERMLLGLTSAERQIAIDLIQIEEGFKNGLTAVQRATVEERLREIATLQQQADLLDQIRGPQAEFLLQQQALLALQQQGKITWDEYTVAIDSARLASLQFATDIDSGITRGMLRLKTEITDLASVAEQTLTNAFRGAEDAIVQFVTTGKADLKSFVNSVLGDLTRLLLRQGISALIGAFTGGGGGLGGGGGGIGGGLLAAFAGKQQGGSFEIGGSGGPDSQLVAFRGTPGETVDVTRKGATPASSQPAAPPNVNVSVVNVDDPSSAIDAINSTEGSRAIMNVIQRNANTVRRQLGGSS